MATKLAWDYRGEKAVATYRGLTIEAIHDDHPENPFEDAESHWPMLVRSGNDRELVVYEPNRRDIDTVIQPLRRFNDHTLVLMQKHIAKALGVTIRELLGNFAHWLEEGEEDADWFTNASLLRDMFDEEMCNVEPRQRLEVIGALYEILEIPCWGGDVRGYSQGDWAEVLVVGVPELVSEWYGDKPDDWRAEKLETALKAQADLYEAWAFGNCWGYIVRSPDGEELDSCWGYYGDYDDSGLEDAAIAAADWHLDRARKRRETTLRDLVRNRVPLHLRAGLLAEAGRLCYG
jgi:hypothetical protein